MLTSVLFALLLFDVCLSAPTRDGGSRKSSILHNLLKLARKLHLTGRSKNPSDVQSKVAPSNNPNSGSDAKSTDSFLVQSRGTQPSSYTDDGVKGASSYKPPIPGKATSSSTVNGASGTSLSTSGATSSSSGPADGPNVGPKTKIYKPPIPKSNADTSIDYVHPALMATAVAETGHTLSNGAGGYSVPGIPLVVGGDGGAATAATGGGGVGLGGIDLTGGGGEGGGADVNCGDAVVSCLGVVGSCLWEVTKGVTKAICNPANYCCCCVN